MRERYEYEHFKINFYQYEQIRIEEPYAYGYFTTEHLMTMYILKQKILGQYVLNIKKTC